MHNYRQLQTHNQLHHDDTSLTFIRNATNVIESKFPTSSTVVEIQSSSCHVAGHLVCSNLLKMLFALYNTEQIGININKNKFDSVSSKKTLILIICN